MQDDSVWFQHGRIQDGCHHKVESEWICEVFFVQMVGTNLGKCEWVWEGKLRWLNANWQNSRWLPSSSWVRMNEVESNWLVWVIVRVKRECFWVNLREENKVSESKMAEFKMAAIMKFSQNDWVKFFLCKMAEFKMSAITNMSQNEWVKLFCAKTNTGNQSWQVWVSLRGHTKMDESMMAKFKMTAITNMSHNESVKFFLCKWWEPILVSVSEFQRKI